MVPNGAFSENGLGKAPFVAEDPTSQRVDANIEADKNHDDRRFRHIFERPQYDALDCEARDKPERDSGENRRPVRHAGLQAHGGYERRKHRHLALGEIDVVRRLINHNQREPEASVDAAHGDAGCDLLQQGVNGEASSFRIRIRASNLLVVQKGGARPRLDGPARLQEVSVVRELEGKRNILLNEQDAHGLLRVDDLHDLEDLTDN